MTVYGTKIKSDIDFPLDLSHINYYKKGIELDCI